MFDDEIIKFKREVYIHPELFPVLPKIHGNTYLRKAANSAICALSAHLIVSATATAPPPNPSPSASQKKRIDTEPAERHFGWHLVVDTDELLHLLGTTHCLFCIFISWYR